MKVDWNKLAYPRLVGRLGENPSRLGVAMHNAGYKALDLPFLYFAHETTDTSAGLSAMRALGLRGMSLTIPHKETAMALVDEVEPLTKKIGASNTIVNTGEALIAYNTDWFGIVEALKEVSFDAAGKTALIYGAGGAARAALVALEQIACGRVLICNRTDKRAEDLAREFSCESVKHVEIEKMDFSSISLFINATPIGLELARGASFPFAFDVFTSEHILFDMIPGETDLIRAARSVGASVVGGERMLLHQALRQFELFTGVEQAPREAMEEALIASLGESSK